MSVLFLLFKFCYITADAMQHTHIEILAQPPICYSRMPFHIMGDHHLPGSGLAAAINIFLVHDKTAFAPPNVPNRVHELPEREVK